MNFNIEPAQHTDIPRLVELLNDLFGVELDFTADATHQERGLALLMAGDASSDRQIVAVARDEAGQAVGMASAQLVISTAEGAPSAWVEDVVVHQDFRGQGIGRRLLDYLIEWAKARGATRMQLVADQENAGADLFYQAVGWHTTQLAVKRRLLK